MNEYNKIQEYPVEELKSADGLIVGPPVYFGALACSGTFHGGALI